MKYSKYLTFFLLLVTICNICLVGRKRAAELKNKSAPTNTLMRMQITVERIAILQYEKQLHSIIQITNLVLPDGNAGGMEVLSKIPVIE